jgi:hypothetical protein
MSPHCAASRSSKVRLVGLAAQRNGRLRCYCGDGGGDKSSLVRNIVWLSKPGGAAGEGSQESAQGYQDRGVLGCKFCAGT